MPKSWKETKEANNESFKVHSSAVVPSLIILLITRFFHWKSANLENAQIFTTGMEDFRALSIKERVILDGVLMDLLLMFRDIQEAHERGLMELDTYNAWLNFLSTTLGMPGGKMWW